ncbi:MAG: bifunctional riboflavin kinase/FAD synthetase [Candidatus Omnitrophica bacterium]|nr:bifunctional riboflavin kinase/FAD synthetase [Candidatus Omnitrophota bacterium]MDE2221863.1 bifunctional riboflavin kinase/FAD synthetase [Candidatus Omnitrophota bacterium]
MKIISLSGHSKLSLKRTCAAIGIFDGVHRGHQYLVKQMLATARRLKLKPIVITFFPHPAHVLRPDISLGYIISLEERFAMLKALGVDTCLVVKFNRAFAKISPEQFVRDILIRKLDVKAVFVGENFRFGKDRSGGVATFERSAQEYGYEMYAVRALKQGPHIISSTLIRQLIGEGKIAQAARLLGRGVSASGPVVKGAGRGRLLGFPTANVAYEADILPPQGVYIVGVRLGSKDYPAMANIGTRPSFEDRSKLHLEIHILDFSASLYGKHLKVEFLKKIRNEKKFHNPKALVRQIQKDEITARKYFNII